ncbi:AI-2E family transporter [Sneathiella chinensis]|uniref:AI-2E family transporter n=1 Tax=Sneathiella chinensis TaxID=349750 RepID=A0ABQ5U750_9PROT|nr:AI-2E family transporter [Sneathiella chinensis]GLQ07038.1 AI-2E family transporter [Sneathiella chinensis]
MTLKQHFRFWAIFVVLFVLFLLLLRDILLPFILGMAVAYFLDPVADKLEEKGMGRTAATSLIVGVFLIVTTVGVILLVPALVDQLIGLLKLLPGYIVAIYDLVRPLIERVVDIPALMESEELRTAITAYAGNAIKNIAGLSNNLLTGGLALLNLISLMVITPVVAFYLLRDWDRITAKIDSWLPRKNLELIRRLVRQIDDVLAGFVRGQSLVCLILAIFYGVSLLIVGLDFGLVIGLVTGLISFIPFVGAIVGFIASVGVALFQFWPDFILIGVVGAIFAVGQILEGYVLTPNLVGDKVGLHPVWIMFGLLAGGALFGFIGVLIAVPAAAVIGVLSRFALEQYLASPIYDAASRSEETKE